MSKLAIVAALTVAFVLPTAAAARTDYDSSVDVLDTSGYGDGDLWAGVVSSKAQKCRKSRELTALADFGSGFEVVDEAVSAKSGGWAMVFPEGALAYKIKLAKRTVGNDLCRGANYFASR